MTAQVHLLTGPARAGKTRRLLDHFRKATQTHFGSTLWISPNQRTAEDVRSHLARGQGALLSAKVLTFQDFVEDIIRVNDPAARPLSNVQRRLLAEVIVTQLQAKKELTHFDRVFDTRGFAEGVFQLLAEFKRNEIWPAHFARAAYQSGAKGRREAKTHRGLSIAVKDRQCARIYARYQWHLNRHRLYDLEGRYWYARDFLARGMRRPFENIRTVIFDGFTDFTRTQLEILESLRQYAAEVWISLPDDPSEQRQELFSRSRATQARLTKLEPHLEWVESSKIPESPLPAGLAHLERQLFRPVRQVISSSDTAGLQLLECPGELGEVRMVARQVKTLLLEGTPAEDILLAFREVKPYASKIAEVFGEYGIPIDIEGTEALGHCPSVATLIRAVRLPEDDWPFGGTSALLRSTYFRPDWPQTRDQSDLPQLGEAFLRMVGKTNGRENYLKALDHWAKDQAPAVDVEKGEVVRRERLHDLALRTKPFFERLFRLWDDAPQAAPLTDHLAWLRRFAQELGLARSAQDSSHDIQALGRFWEELEDWQELDRRLQDQPRLLDSKAFLRVLAVVARESGLARTPRGPGRVRVLSADLARNVSTPYLFVMGLSEKSFPDLSVTEPFFEESERQAFKKAGLDFPCAGDLLPDEMLLFYQLITCAGRQLVLSYPAIDERGQALLPSPFLTAVLECFESGAIPTVCRRMLIEGFDRDNPLSPAEQRVQAAVQAERNGTALVNLPPGLTRQLGNAQLMATRRFREATFNSFDGLLRDPGVIADLQQKVGSGKTFSPTSLEDYVACPFKFFLKHVLRLEPLEEPSDEIEGTDRGLVVHRVMSQFHAQLKKEALHRPTEDLDARLHEILNQEVDLLAKQASVAGEVLWRLEGKRLGKRAARYRQDWQEFVETFRPAGLSPIPSEFEKSFGLKGSDLGPLILQDDGVEVRIGGQIDRVDIVQRGDEFYFWIIDYKTGRATHYTASALKSFERLQLTLYALAVERVLLAEKKARPVALAYWLITDQGPKVVMPWKGGAHAWITATDRWPEIRQLLEKLVVDLVRNIREGSFPLHPRSENCTETCSFGQICRIAQSRSVEKSWANELPVIS